MAQLAKLIRETMPEDEPGVLTAQEAQAVAAHVHDSFYSAVARARIRPARIELARLTVRQYRRAVADLVASFGEPARWGEERGLRGEYYEDRQPGRDDRRAALRIDPKVDFDFGTEAPMHEVKKRRSFSIRWGGSVLAPETGEYAFIVRTNHAARLWVNDTESPLIDAWVKSGDKTRYKARLFLVGGRAYPLRLEFSKATQGVRSEEKKKKQPPVEAFVSLLWQRPKSVQEVIPAGRLSPATASETYICAVPFPPDDRSYGWERGTAVSPEWDHATTTAAINAAAYVAGRVNELAGTARDAPDRAEKLRTFCRRFAERAFRRPLDNELSAHYVGRQFEAAGDADAAVRRVILLVLKSPRFLYREIAGGAGSSDVAARLAFGLWDSIPDRQLFKAARSGQLSTADEVRRQAERMLTDSRAQAKLREFLLTWLKADAAVDLNKDTQQFPEFDVGCAADLRTSLELFLDDVLESKDADYRRLLLGDEVYLNDRLAKLYGIEAAADADFVKVKLDEGMRAGVLTHPYVMARFADRSESSPIHRGVFLARGVLGQSLRPPPEAFTPLPPNLHPDLTTRERVALQTEAAACMTCHAIINPLGFTLERFDAIGRYRDFDRGKPVDDTAEYQPRSGEAVRLSGARELAEYLAGSEECHAAFTEQLFHHLVQQPVQAYTPTLLDELRQAFAAHNFNIRTLAVEIMVATALVGRETK